MKLIKLATAAAVLVGIAYFAQAQTVRTASLSWGAVTKDVEGNAITGVTYKVYQGPKGGTKTVIRTGLTVTALVLSSLPSGETCWQISANIAGGGESGLSNEACKSFPFLAPAAPTLVVD